MTGFNVIETIRIEAGTEAKKAEPFGQLSAGSPQIMIDNEGINTVYASVKGDAIVPGDGPSEHSIPVLPQSTKIITRGSGEISLITNNGTSFVSLSTGQST